MKKIFLYSLFIIIIIASLSAILVNNSSIDVNENKENVSIAVTGDVMFARNMPNVLSPDLSPFKGVSDVISNVDLLLINFENAATTSTNPLKSDIPLKCSPYYVPLVKANNLTVVALANNHALDYGIDGMNDTIKNLNDSGILSIGAGNSEDDAHQAIVKEINGRKIMILNYMDSKNFAEYSYDTMPYANGTSPGYSAYDSQDAYKQISKNNDSNLIIVYMHYGNEYSSSPNENQINISHELIDYGADIVIGTHPHVTQGIEMYKGKPIFYSLGNFIFDQSNTQTHSAYFVKIDLINNTGKCCVYPIYISNYLPQYMNSNDGTNLLKGLNPSTDQLEITDNGTAFLNFKSILINSFSVLLLLELYI